MSASWSAVVVPADQGADSLLLLDALTLPLTLTRWRGWRCARVDLDPLLPSDVLALVELLANLNLVWLRGQAVPPMREMRLSARTDPGEPELWVAAPWLITDDRLPRDCKTLSAWRLAELRLRGERARPAVQWTVDPSGDVAYHVLVARADGGVEDPLAEARRAK